MDERSSFTASLPAFRYNLTLIWLHLQEPYSQMRSLLYAWELEFEHIFLYDTIITHNTCFYFLES